MEVTNLFQDHVSSVLYTDGTLDSVGFKLQNKKFKYNLSDIMWYLKHKNKLVWLEIKFSAY